MAMVEQNPPADVTPESSPEPQQGVPEPQHQEGEARKPAEAGTETPGPIPYERFKEVNDQLKDLKALKDSQDWQGYQKLKDQLATDPKFAAHFINSINSFYTPPQQTQKPDPYAEFPKELAEPLRKTEVLEQAVQTLMYENQVQKAQGLYQQYSSRLNEKLTSVPEHWRDFYREQVEMAAARINPNALANYDQTLVDKAFEQIHQRAIQIQRAERGSYVSDKRQDKAPVSSSGAAPMQTQKSTSNQDERAALV